MDTQQRPLIILGAGASHDFVNADLRRQATPPLTDHLVRREILNYDDLQKYPEAADLFSRIAPLVLRGTNPLSFEQALREISTRAESVALRFYLADLFSEVSRRNATEHLNNYRALIGYIEQSPAKGADVVTFNYDTLFEAQFGARRSFKDVNDYIAQNHPIRIFKAHGSADWYYIMQKTPMQPDWGIHNGYDYLKRAEDYVPGPIHTRALLNGIPRANEFHRIPAIALPTVETKQFVLPDNHVQLLEDAIGSASRILIIGWKAGDKHILDLMNQRIKREVPVYLVTGPNGSEDMKKNLATVSNLNVVGEEAGFSNFIGSAMARVFFGLTGPELPSAVVDIAGAKV